MNRFLRMMVIVLIQSVTYNQRNGLQQIPHSPGMFETLTLAGSLHAQHFQFPPYVSVHNRCMCCINRVAQDNLKNTWSNICSLCTGSHLNKSHID